MEVSRRKQSDFFIILCGEACAGADKAAFEEDSAWRAQLLAGMLLGDTPSVPLVAPWPCSFPLAPLSSALTGAGPKSSCASFLFFTPHPWLSLWGGAFKHNSLGIILSTPGILNVL